MNQHVPYIVADPKNRVWDSYEYAGRTHPANAHIILPLRWAYVQLTLGVPNQTSNYKHACHACMGPFPTYSTKNHKQ